MSQRRLSILCVFTSALLFSLGGICIKLIPWNALSINAARSLISLILVGTFLLVTKHKIIVNRFVLLGAFCMFGTTTFYVLANKLTTAANTIVLQFTAPLFIIFFLWIFFHEKPKKLEIITCVAVFTGILFFFIDSLESGGALGNFLAILSGIAYAGVFMMNTFPNADPISSIFIGQAMSVAVGFPFLLQETTFSKTAVVSVLILGVFQLGIAYICLSIGLKQVPPVTASLISGFEPVLNPLLVALIYGEKISLAAFCGAVIVLTSVLTYNVIKAKMPAKKVQPDT
jgi:EamA-like transporter family.